MERRHQNTILNGRKIDYQLQSGGNFRGVRLGERETVEGQAESGKQYHGRYGDLCRLKKVDASTSIQGKSDSHRFRSLREELKMKSRPCY